MLKNNFTNISEVGKAILVTGHGGPKGCETSKFPHFLDQWSSTWGKHTPGVREDILRGMRKHLTGYVTLKNNIIS
jgi:hypothetical protein